MLDIAKKFIEIGIIKELHEQGLLTEEQNKLAIDEINRTFDNIASKKCSI